MGESHAPGVTDLLLAVDGRAPEIAGACPWCSGPFSAVVHGGACPRVKAITYHSNGTVARVEFQDGPDA